MAISNVVKSYLDEKGIAFELSEHPLTATSEQTAAAAHIKRDHLAKAVLLRNDWQYLMVVVPADSQVELEKVSEIMGRDYQLAPEIKAESLLDDCQPGAIPPIGRAYGMETLVDDTLDSLSDVYFEAGDHQHLVHIDGAAFHRLVKDCRHGHFARHAA